MEKPVPGPAAAAHTQRGSGGLPPCQPARRRPARLPLADQKARARVRPAGAHERCTVRGPLHGYRVGVRARPGPRLARH